MIVYAGTVRLNKIRMKYLIEKFLPKDYSEVQEYHKIVLDKNV